MRSLILTFAVLVIIVTTATSQITHDYPITPVPFTSVIMADSFWLPKIHINHNVTIPHALEQSAGRIKNFSIAAGLETGIFQTQYPFDDSDVYKIIEAASYSLYYNPDPALETKIDSIINIIRLAQEPDGYLYTARRFNSFPTGFPTSWLGSARWEKEHDLSHETYNLGHLFEAACAWHQATGKDNLLQIAIKAANLLDTTFGWGKLQTYPGHQIVEVGLARLYRLTGDIRYLALARFFLDVRGPGGEEYSQAHLRVVDQTKAVGHSVRAAYMYAGMADVAALYNDQSYISAIDKIWEDIVTKKLYITGGIGASGGNEGFSDDYNLPNSTAYCETCASIGNIYFNHRLFLLKGDARYIDILERTLYNSLLSGVSLTGDRFFYPNRLASAGTTTRSVWFGCACCPPNIAKLIPSVPSYIYAYKTDTLYVNLFMSDTAAFDFNGAGMEVIQNTGYPYNGVVSIVVNPEAGSEFSLMVRIPGWAGNEPISGNLYSFAADSEQRPTIKVNGESFSYNVSKGYAVIRRKWEIGDNIILNLPMEPHKVIAHDQVLDNRNRFAVQMGPLVYCAEGPDNQAGFDLFRYAEDVGMQPSFERSLLGGTPVIRLKSAKPDGSEDKEVTLIPYSLWSNRGAAKMQVWLSANIQVTYPDSLHLITSQDSATTNYVSSWEDLNSIFDLYEHSSSSDKGPGAFGNWAGDGRTVGRWNWVQYNFTDIKAISSSEVYWWRDGAGINIPDSSYLSWHNENTDSFVRIASTLRAGAAIQADRYNKEVFPVVNTRQIRLNFYDRTMAQGILEWKVYKPNTTIDINDLQNSEYHLQVFPNPAREYITVKSEMPGQAKLEVFSSSGKMVFNTGLRGSITIDCSILGGRGIYYLRLIGTGMIRSGTIIIL